MPDRIFHVTLDDGREFDIHADHQPTNEEALAAINNQPALVAAPTPVKKQPSDISMTLGGVIDKATTPLFTQETALTPEMRKALEFQPQPSVTESFSDKMARYSENAARYATGKMLGFGQTMSSPLNLGLAVTSFASPVAESFGMPSLARTLEAPGRITSGVMAGKGLYDIGSGNILPGAGEVGLGILGMKSNLPPVGSTLEQYGATVPPNAPPQMAPPEPTLASTKLMQAIESSGLGKTKGEWEAQLAQERARRFATAEAVQTTGMAGLEEMKGALSGNIEKPGFAPIQLQQSDIDQLANEIIASPRLNTPEKIRAGDALRKLFRGELLQNNEIETLGRVWGQDLTKSLMEGRPWTRKGVSLLAQGVDITKSLVTAGHFSAPFRNAIALIHKGQFWSSFNEMFQAFGSEENYNRIRAAITTLPDYKLMKNTGLALPELTDPLALREDELRNRITEKIPIYGKYWIKPGNRAYQAYLATIRSTTAQDLINYYTQVAQSMPDPKMRLALDPHTNLAFTGQLMEYVNSASGRGSLEMFERNANGLNIFFMSPRMQAARIQLVKMALGLGQTPPQVRKEALKSLAALMSAGLTLGGLTYMGGGKIDMSHPTSSDFLKSQVGEARLDPYGGAQQYVVALARQTPYLGGGTTNIRTEQFQPFGKRFRGNITTRYDALSDFVANHASPPFKAAYDLLNTKEKKGGLSSFDYNKEAAGMLLPITAQQIMEISKENPKLLPLAIPGSFGIGVNVPSSR